MYKILEVDKIRFTDDSYTADSKYVIPAIEISDGRSLKEFVTIYVKAENVKDLKEFEDSIIDILPGAGYHDPGYFHLDNTMPMLSGSVRHYHILTERHPDKEIMEKLLVRLYEELGEMAINKQLTKEILNTL